MAEDIRELLALYDITEQDLERIRAFGDIVRGRLPDHVVGFYEWLELQPEFRLLFTDPEELERVKRLQLTYWSQFLDAKTDDEYLRQRRTVGEVHARVGLTLQTYFAAMNVALVLLLERLYDGSLPAERFEACARSVTKLAHFDTAIVVDTYSRITNELIAEQGRALQEATRKVREARARELEIAREIQRGILPDDLGAATENSGLDIHAHLEPAAEVGGDLFEVLRASDDRLVVALGDVSGKGIPAALFMAMTVTLLRSVSRRLEGPDAILRGVSEELASHNPRGLFVTLFCAVVDLRRRVLSYANCGHPPPVLLRDGFPPEFVFPATGTVAGVIPGIEILSKTVPLVRGGTYVFYSDGVTEAFDPDGEQFGYDRLLAALSQSNDAPAAEIVRTVVRSVAKHACGAPPSDDLAVLVLRVP